MVIYYIDHWKIVIGSDSKVIDKDDKPQNFNGCKIFHIGNYFYTTVGGLKITESDQNWDLTDDINICFKNSTMNIGDQLKFFEDYEMIRCKFVVQKLRAMHFYESNLFSIGFYGFDANGNSFVCTYDFNAKPLSSNIDSIYYTKMFYTYTLENNNSLNHFSCAGTNIGMDSIIKYINTNPIGNNDTIAPYIEKLLTVSCDADPNKIDTPFDIVILNLNVYQWYRRKPECSE